MATAKRERRRRERRRFSDYMQFKNDRTGELMGDLADISLDGFRLEGSRRIQPNAEFQFRVDLPPDVPGKASIVVIAHSRWIRPHPVDPRLYVSGYEIMHMEPSDSRAFTSFYDRYGSSGAPKDTNYDYLWKD